jgi:hypothetical protein
MEGPCQFGTLGDYKARSGVVCGDALSLACRLPKGAISPYMANVRLRVARDIRPSPQSECTRESKLQIWHHYSDITIAIIYMYMIFSNFDYPQNRTHISIHI